VRDITLEKEAEEKLRRAFEEIKELKEQLYRENPGPEKEIDESSMFEEIVGSSETAPESLGPSAKVAQSDSTVLILGETGTGKELIARAIHKRSNRSNEGVVRGTVRNSSFINPFRTLSGTRKAPSRGPCSGGLDGLNWLMAGPSPGRNWRSPSRNPKSPPAMLQEREFDVWGPVTISIDVRVLAARTVTSERLWRLEHSGKISFTDSTFFPLRCHHFGNAWMIFLSWLNI